jgi:hypothetical protein
MARWLLVLALAVSPLIAQDAALSASAQKKFDQISAHTLKPGSVVALSLAELNAWSRVKVHEAAPEGVRNPVLELGKESATGSALVDFLKIRHGQGKDTGWLMSKLIEGERPLKVFVTVSSYGGRATIFLKRVELSGAVLSGSTLDFLINNFFRPLYPDAKINEPFDLDESIDHVEVEPSGLKIFIKR